LIPMITVINSMKYQGGIMDFDQFPYKFYNSTIIY
jgi:hypothetical protein